MAPDQRSAEIEPGDLADLLLGDDELALVDAREEGVYNHSHLFHAVNLPLSHLELRLEALIPRRTTLIVWCDDGRSALAQRAAERAIGWGWANSVVLRGGTDAWAAADYELYAGVHVPSKAFGELIEHTRGTPRITATELAERLSSGNHLVVLDARPMDEFRRRSIPGGIDCPGAELVHRVREAAPDPGTLVVVNCAGRTRSIIGAQSLIDAGLPNPVMALENGTMGWELAGFESAKGCQDEAPRPQTTARRWASEAAATVAKRFGVTEIDPATLTQWLADTDRTTYLLDVRTTDEFEQGHLPGSVHAPGGQLVQATDSYVATRNARLVLLDNDGVRATMTASWLRQMGWHDAVILSGGIEAVVTNTGAGLGSLVKGHSPRPDLARVSAPTIRPPALAERLAADDANVTVIDVGSSIKYRRRGHIPGSCWAVRSRLDEARAAIGDALTIVLTSSDGTLAKLAVADAKRHWPAADVVALTAGNKGWRHAGFDMEPGFTRPTTAPDDVWYSPYDHDSDTEAYQLAYLTWETALLDQIERDPLVTFPRFA